MRFSHLVELRLTAFKSFRDAVLPLGDVTILIGRNSAGKSNALDGLEVLARLAEGDDLVDALDGRRREGGPVRGGSEGCAPHGADRFSLGCTVRCDDTEAIEGYSEYDYDLTVEVRPDLRVVSERLYGPGIALKSGRWSRGVLVETREPGAPGTGLEAEIHNGKRGHNATHVFRDSRLVISQVPLAVLGANRAEESVLAGVTAVLLALRGVFHLDPVPHLMRGFVPARDVELRRTGENVSAALQSLERTDYQSFERVEELVAQIADERIEGIDFVRSDLGDVMVALDERYGPTSQRERTPAREMSDGLLRFVAIATALLSAQTGLDVDASVPDRGHSDEEALRGAVLVVLEELENGLHSSQARRVLELVRLSAADPGTRVLVTTHSPAILDAAEGELNEHVIVCHREPGSGYSTLSPLMELPGYARAMAQGSLGYAVTSGALVASAHDLSPTDHSYAEFERVLGIR